MLLSSVRLTDRPHLQRTGRIVQVADNQSISYRWALMKEVDKSQESDGGDFEPTPDIVWQQSQSKITACRI